jgi:CIC family chloride channel protein
MAQSDNKPINLTWIFTLSIVIGLVAGVVAWIFRLLIGFVHNLAFYGQFSTEYDVTQHSTQSSWGWLIIFVPVIGGLIVVWITRNLSKEAKGPGIAEVIDSIHYNQAKIPRRLVFTKALASAITIGSGGSLGREGPIVQIGAAISATLAEFFKLPTRQRIVLIGCGASAGIAATFNAPLAGMLFSIELLLISINSQTILPVAISSAIGAYVGRLLIGPEPAFSVPNLYQADSLAKSLAEIALFIPFGAVMGLLALALIKTLSWSDDFFERITANDYLRHSLGTFALGLLMFSMYKFSGHYYVQGVGYATITDLLTGVISNPWFMLMLLALKLIATALTVSSGGSGGVFSPSLFLGATAGSLYGNLVVMIFPDLGINPAVFVMVGMAATIAAATSAPLTAAIITYEMTLEYEMVLPLMIAVGIAYALRRWLIPTDIYTTRLLKRGHIIPEGLSTDITGNIKIEHLMNRHFRVLEHQQTYSSFDGISVVSKEGAIAGVIPAINHTIEYDVSADDLMHTGFVILSPKLSLMGALRHLHDNKTSFAVISTDARPGIEDVIGVLSESEIHQVLERASELHQGHN